MAEFLLYGATIFALCLMCIVIYKVSNSSLVYDAPGERIWRDRGRFTKPFLHKRFQITGKPHSICQTRNGLLAIVHCDHLGPVQASDIAGAKAVALAARGNGYHITQLLITTRSFCRRIRLPDLDQALFDEIRRYVLLAGYAHAGLQMQAKPSPRKCSDCKFKVACSSSPHRDQSVI